MKMPNMQAMMQQAQQMQKKMQEEVAQIRVEASAGGGMVTIKMDGHKNITGVKIDPEVAGDVEMLQDLVMAASNEATKKVVEPILKMLNKLARGVRVIAPATGQVAVIKEVLTHYTPPAALGFVLPQRTTFINYVGG